HRRLAGIRQDEQGGRAAVRREPHSAEHDRGHRVLLRPVGNAGEVQRPQFNMRRARHLDTTHAIGKRQLTAPRTAAISTPLFARAPRRRWRYEAAPRIREDKPARTWLIRA